ncbi:hypothetical protein [Methanooceanicella nereidis]|nr:hypothetical protein [Methanocella sp. CWC-04]
MLSISVITEIISIIKVLLEGIFSLTPKKSTVPDDFDSMHNIAMEKARMDAAPLYREMQKLSRRMCGRDAIRYRRKKEKEINRFIAERTQHYINVQIELSRIKR